MSEMVPQCSKGTLERAGGGSLMFSGVADDQCLHWE